MVSVLAATNLIETLAVIMISAISFLTFFVVYILKLFMVKTLYEEPIRHDSRFVQYENGFYFWITWFGTCFLTALLFSISFSEIYNIAEVVDGAPYILSLYVIYLALMTCWVFIQYVWIRQTRTFAIILIVLVYLVTLFNFVLVFRLPESNLQHSFLVLLLLIPPTFAIFATNASTTFRIDILHTIQKKGQYPNINVLQIDPSATVYQHVHSTQKHFTAGGDFTMHVDGFGDGR